jgi:hypothetical protein
LTAAKPRLGTTVDRLAIAALMLTALVLAGMAWLRQHPEHNPWAPLSLDDPPGWATTRKLASLRNDPRECRAVLTRSDVAFTRLPPLGADACRWEDRLRIASAEDRGAALTPLGNGATCAVEAGLARWLDQVVQPAARTHLGSPAVALEHYGTYQCRRVGNSTDGRWSEHATGNAIDISAVRLADGRRIVVQRDWTRQGTPAATFLRRIRDGACPIFATVLSPDYNRAHFDHFHLDQEPRAMGWSLCR